MTIFWGQPSSYTNYFVGYHLGTRDLTFCPISKVRDLFGPLFDCATSTLPPGTDHGNAIVAVGLLGGLCSDGGLPGNQLSCSIFCGQFIY